MLTLFTMGVNVNVETVQLCVYPVTLWAKLTAVNKHNAVKSTKHFLRKGTLTCVEDCFILFFFTLVAMQNAQTVWIG